MDSASPFRPSGGSPTVPATSTPRRATHPTTTATPGTRLRAPARRTRRRTAAATAWPGGTSTTRRPMSSRACRSTRTLTRRVPRKARTRSRLSTSARAASSREVAWRRPSRPRPSRTSPATCWSRPAASGSPLMSRRGVLSICLATALVGTTGALAATRSANQCTSPDWRSFGAGVVHSFSVAVNCSPITPTTVSTLVPAWELHTSDSVTASPAIADGTAFVGSWDGSFYAVDVATGALKWTFQITTHARSAFGRIVSSATVEPYRDPPSGRQRDVVLFGGGSSLWALDVRTGKELAAIDLDPRDPAVRHEQDTGPNPPVAEVESSPAVATVGGVRRIYVGIDVHNDDHVGRTGLVAVRLVPGARHWRFEPQWKYDVETARTYRGEDGLTTGSGKGWGCGGVWSSPAVDVHNAVVAFGTASCDYPDK